MNSVNLAKMNRLPHRVSRRRSRTNQWNECQPMNQVPVNASQWIEQGPNSLGNSNSLFVKNLQFRISPKKSLIHSHPRLLVAQRCQVRLEQGHKFAYINHALRALLYLCSYEVTSLKFGLKLKQFFAVDSGDSFSAFKCSMMSSGPHEHLVTRF